MPADAVDLRQREHAPKAPGKHVPQALLEVLGADALGHLVLADHALRQQHLTQVGLLKLGAGDVAEHDAVAPGKAELAGMRVALLTDEGRIPLQQLDHSVGIDAGLLEGIGGALEARGRDEHGAELVDALQVLQLPVLDLQHQDAAARVQDQEVGMRAAGADGHVVPEQVVVLELGLQALGQAAFARGHPGFAAVEGRNQGSHGRASPFAFASLRAWAGVRAGPGSYLRA